MCNEMKYYEEKVCADTKKHSIRLTSLLRNTNLMFGIHVRTYTYTFVYTKLIMTVKHNCSFFWSFCTV